jgi:hypothetical protein
MVSFDEYDMLLEMLNYHYTGKHSKLLKYNESVAIRLAERLDIDIEGRYELVLCNDDVNDMIHVVLALYEVAKLNNEDAMQRMVEAHQTGGAVILRRSFAELIPVKNQLEDRNLTCVIIKSV